MDHGDDESRVRNKERGMAKRVGVRARTRNRERKIHTDTDTHSVTHTEKGREGADCELRSRHVVRSGDKLQT